MFFFCVLLFPEKGILIAEKKELFRRNSRIYDLNPALSSVYKRCCNDENKKLVILPGSDASKVYESYHDEVVLFRLEKKGNSFSRIVKSKSLGILLRLTGVMSLLRNAVKAITSEEIPAYDDFIEKQDIDRALEIVRYHVGTSIAIATVNAAENRFQNLKT